MEHYLILARSITYAQRMQSVLTRAGIRCQVFRAPRELTNLGCAYTVRISAADFTPATIILRRESLNPVQIFFFQNGRYREVIL